MRDARGFTLIEMIVVLAVLALVSGLVLSRGPQRSAALEMQRATATVSAALRVARTRAIATNQSIVVLFDTKATTVQVNGEAVRSLPRGVALGVTVADGIGTSPTIVFLPDGSSTGGHIDLSGGGRVTWIGVEWLTGRVTVADRH